MNYNYNTFQGKNHLNYVVFTPNCIRKNLPLIVYLHGAGERGGVYQHIFRHGLAKAVYNGKDIEAIMLCPQCPATRVWDNVIDDVKEIIDMVAKEYSVDMCRVSITGSSMGGFGTWMAGLTYPNFFSAIAPVSGGGMSWRTAKLIKTPVFAYHGDLDDVVPITYSQLMVEALKEKGGNAELYVIEGYGHNDAIDYAYSQTDLVEKLLACKRTDFERVPEVCEELFE